MVARAAECEAGRTYSVVGAASAARQPIRQCRALAVMTPSRLKPVLPLRHYPNLPPCRSFRGGVPPSNARLLRISAFVGAAEQREAAKAVCQPGRHRGRRNLRRLLRIPASYQRRSAITALAPPHQWPAPHYPQAPPLPRAKASTNLDRSPQSVSCANVASPTR